MQSQIRNEQISFTRGVPALEALPNKLVSECMQAVLEGPNSKTILQYGQNAGYLPLRQFLADQYHVAFEQVLVGNGSLHLQDLLAAILLKPGDVVFVEQPSYDRAIKTFRRRGAQVIGIPLEPDGISIQALEEAIAQKIPAFLYVIPDFQNPTGVTMSAEKRQAVAHLAQRYNFWLLEDVPYRTLRYTGDTLPLLRDFNAEHVLTISSYSKLIGPALRVGYVIGPTQLVQSLARLTEDTILTPVLPSQAAVIEFYNKGFFSTHLEYLRQIYAPRLQTITTALHTYLPQIALTVPEGGFFVSITVPEQTKEQDFLSRARKAGILLTDGRDFFADPLHENERQSAEEHFLRLPFCALTPAQLQAGIKRLATLLA